MIFLVLAFVGLCAHDMFLKMDSFFLEPNQPSEIRLFNGTFDKSDNVITRDRMIDVSLVGNGIRESVDSSHWSDRGLETILKFDSGEPGTWVAGLSTRARNIELSAEDFNGYLEHDGVLDMLEQRKKDGTINDAAIERYSKHVKTIFQVGDSRTDDWKSVLNYPIEFVPLQNPYDLEVGDSFKVRLLREGQPLSDQLVYTGFGGSGHVHEEGEGSDDAEEAHHHDERQWRTDVNGEVAIKIDHGGKWYIRSIHMTLLDEPGLTHESNWATLTFEVDGPLHGSGGKRVLYWVLAVVIVAGLLSYFKMKK